MRFHAILTLSEADRPQKSNIWVKSEVESELEVENAQCLCLDPKIDKNTITDNSENKPLLQLP